ncbi:MAG: hypothetical protein LAT79_18420 [Kiritimatiellae bacterium]|nr:hypothetical protein [Kiritimatiellia bacterium]
MMSKMINKIHFIRLALLIQTGEMWAADFDPGKIFDKLDLNLHRERGTIVYEKRFSPMETTFIPGDWKFEGWEQQDHPDKFILWYLSGKGSSWLLPETPMTPSFIENAVETESKQIQKIEPEDSGQISTPEEDHP